MSSWVGVRIRAGRPRRGECDGERERDIVVVVAAALLLSQLPTTLLMMRVGMLADIHTHTRATFI